MQYIQCHYLWCMNWFFQTIVGNIRLQTQAAEMRVLKGVAGLSSDGAEKIKYLECVWHRAAAASC